jgi:hypothetical protein
MSQLDELHMGRTGIGDATLAHLARLTRLRDLRLQGTRVTDAGVRRLATLARLEVLDLSDTSVGDAGLLALAGLPELRLLIVDHTKVTEAAISELKNARPRLQVWRLPGRSTGVRKSPLWYPGGREDECFTPKNAYEGEHARCTTT